MSEDYYKSGRNNREGYGSRQEGFTNENGSRQGGYRSSRPRFSRPANNGNGGNSRYEGGEYRNNRNYEQRGSYQPRFNGGRNDYNNRNEEGGFNANRGGGNRYGKSRYNQNEGGYRSNNYGSNNRSYEGYDRGGEGNNRSQQNFQGGFNRGGNSQRGGFQPRYNNSHRSAEGGFSGRPQAGGRGNYNPHAKYSNKKRLEYKEENYDPTVPIRLNKFLANAGVCSRRDADKYIEAGVVTVNGEIVTELGAKVLRTDEVKFHDNPVRIEKKVYVLLNKPKGYVTTSEDPQNRKTVMDLVQNACPERIYPVGRLDRNTTGVLLLTNDGEMASKLTHPKFLKKKIYHVTTDQNVSAADIQRIAEGITLEDGEIAADAIEYAHSTDKKQVGIEIHSGKNRIVRRIFESLGYHVVKLDRVYFAGLTKKNVRRGDWRYLTEKEVQMLRMGAFE